LHYSKLATLGFAVCLTLAAYRAYQYPSYTSDGFLYMANAVAMHGDSIKAIHDTVYLEVSTTIPKPALDHLLGNDPVETSQSQSFHARAVDPYRFAEFLPCFAVRPVFNELVYVLHYKVGIGLLRATVLISVAAYWALGWIVFTWISRYVAEPWAALVSALLMLTPPVWDLARWPMPDEAGRFARNLPEERRSHGLRRDPTRADATPRPLHRAARRREPPARRCAR